MFSFDPKSRILKVQKIPEPELELNLLEYQRESYNSESVLDRCIRYPCMRLLSQ